MKHKDNTIDSIIANSSLKKQYYTIPEATKMFNMVKPGAHVLLFVSTLTQDIMGVNARLSGFDVRDTIHIPAYKANIIVCRKPLSESTVAANTLKWGTGGLNIDASRIGTDTITVNQVTLAGMQGGRGGSNQATGIKQEQLGVSTQTSGRFPANIILDETTAEMLDEQSGVSKSTGGRTITNGFKQWTGHLNATNKVGAFTEKGDPGFGDTGGASRFFYKANSNKELLKYLETLITPTNGVCIIK